MSSYLVDVICIQESNFNLSSSFRIPGFSARRFDRTHSRSGIFSLDATHARGGVIISVRQDLSFSEVYTFFVSSLDPYFNYVGVNTSLNNSSSVPFFNVYVTLFALLRLIAEPTPFLPPFFSLPEISSFWGTSITITPFGTPQVLPISVVRKYSIGSFSLTFSSMTLTYLLFLIAPPLAFLLLLLLSPSLDPGRCFRTWVLIT